MSNKLPGIPCTYTETDLHTQNQERLSPQAVQIVQQEIDRQVADGLSPSVGVAVWVRGGITSFRAGEAGTDSIFRAFSCGKPLAAAVLWRLHDRGLLDWDAPVCDYWPEFASNGKRRVTIDHVLTHRAGLPSDPGIPFSAYGNWEQVVAYLEDAPLEYEPGERYVYHSLTFGWLVGEIASRITGKPFLEAFRDEVTTPLALADTSYELEPSLHHRVLPLVAAPDFENQSFVDWFDSILKYRLVMPGGSCLSTPGDMARFYSVLVSGGTVDGVQWLRPETVHEITKKRVEAVDTETGSVARRTRGMALPGVPPNTYAASWESPTFGHGGAGTSTTWADPSIGAATAVLNTGLQPRAKNRARLNRISAAIREATRIG